MKKFMDEKFLLNSSTAERLYAAIADLPIVDYHCHLDASEIYNDKHFASITEVWLGGDHYKWRAMRNMGVEERLITGDGDDYEKFVAWATIMPYMAGHPLYHFSHLELRKYLGIDTPLNEHTARAVYEEANAALKELGARKILEKAGVETVVTTNDPVEDLGYHARLRKEGFLVKVLPAFRPDKAVNIEKAGFADYVASLAKVAGYEIKSFTDIKRALRDRLAFFVSNGCKATDHGLDRMPSFVPFSDAEADEVFRKAMSAMPLTTREADGYKTNLLLFLATEYADRDIVMEIHFGCKRNPNSAMFRKLGADAGFDCIAGDTNADALYPFFDALERTDSLPRTLIFSLNPNDNDELVTVCGAFNKAPCKGKVQQGSAWWFNDNKPGMERQLSTYAAGIPIDTFIGMLTDSRSLLSYARHDYFRRILANFLGSLVENGEYPESDMEYLEKIAKNVAYYNVKNYFGI